MYIYIYILYMYMYTFIFIFILCVYTSNCRYQHRSQVRDNILIETLGTRGSQKPTTLTDWQRQGNQLLALWDLFLTGCRGTKILLRPSSLWTDSRYIFNIFFGFQQFSPNFFRLHPSIFFWGFNQETVKGSYRHTACCFLCGALANCSDENQGFLYTNWGREAAYRSQFLSRP